MLRSSCTDCLTVSGVVRKAKTSIMAAVRAPLRKTRPSWNEPGHASLHAKTHLQQLDKRPGLRRLRVKYVTREVFRFWQPAGGYDHNIFKEKTVASVIEYLHANPPRRRLVNDPLK